MEINFSDNIVFQQLYAPELSPTCHPQQKNPRFFNEWDFLIPVHCVFRQKWSNLIPWTENYIQKPPEQLITGYCEPFYYTIQALMTISDPFWSLLMAVRDLNSSLKMLWLKVGKSQKAFSIWLHPQKTPNLITNLEVNIFWEGHKNLVQSS